jgi:hypothetical protein
MNWRAVAFYFIVHRSAFIIRFYRSGAAVFKGGANTPKATAPLHLGQSVGALWLVDRAFERQRSGCTCCYRRDRVCNQSHRRAVSDD